MEWTKRQRITQTVKVKEKDSRKKKNRKTNNKKSMPHEKRKVDEE